MAEEESVRTVIVALLANLAIAIAKLVAARITGSTAVAAEAAHAFADAGNEVLLLVAHRRSRRPPDADHPIGHGRESYFWALLASVAVFVAGAVFSLGEGLLELASPEPATGFAIAYGVLAFAAALDTVSLVRAVRQLRKEAHELRRDPVEHLALTSDPTLRAVITEDVAGVLGDVIAFFGVLLHQLTGSSVPDAIAAILIGLVLVGVGIHLADRNRDFLLGQQASPAVRERLETFVRDQSGVTAVREMLVTFVGPRRMWVLVRIDILDRLRGDEVKRLVRDLDSGLRHESKYIERVDVVPMG